MQMMLLEALIKTNLAKPTARIRARAPRNTGGWSRVETAAEINDAKTGIRRPLTAVVNQWKEVGALHGNPSNNVGQNRDSLNVLSSLTGSASNAEFRSRQLANMSPEAKADREAKSRR